MTATGQDLKVGVGDERGHAPPLFETKEGVEGAKDNERRHRQFGINIPTVPLGEDDFG